MRSVKIGQIYENGQDHLAFLVGWTGPERRSAELSEASVKNRLLIVERKGVEFRRVGRSAPTPRRLRPTLFAAGDLLKDCCRKKCADTEAIETLACLWC